MIMYLQHVDSSMVTIATAQTGVHMQQARCGASGLQAGHQRRGRGAHPLFSMVLRSFGSVLPQSTSGWAAHHLPKFLCRTAVARQSAAAAHSPKQMV